MNPKPLSPSSSTEEAVVPLVSTTAAGGQPTPLIDIEAVAARLGVPVATSAAWWPSVGSRT